MALREAIAQSRSLSDLAAWLADLNGTGTEPMAFIEKSYFRLPAAKQRSVIRRVQSGDQSQADSVISELLIFETCHLLKLEPTFQPTIDGLTPDLQLVASGVDYIADVFLTNRPASTLQQFGGLDGYADAGEASKKIADTIASKATKYKPSGMPLLIFVVFGGHDVDQGDLQAALYGSTIAEILANGTVDEQMHDQQGRHGLICPPDADARHDNLSAVVGCDWFDTLNREDPGRRLHCIVYHHWGAQRTLRGSSFVPFGQVLWKVADGRCEALIDENTDVVIKTDSNDRLIYDRYSAESPW